MQRAAPWVLWIGLAVLILGIVIGGLGVFDLVTAITEAIDTGVDPGEERGERAVGAAALGISAVILGFLMLVVGAVVKLVTPKSR